MNASTALVRIPVRQVSHSGWVALRRRMFEAAMDVAAGEVRVWMERLEARRLLSAASLATFPESAGMRDAQVWAEDIEPTADGKFIVVGDLANHDSPDQNSNWNSWAIARFNADGTPDATFGIDGSGIEAVTVGLEPTGDYVLPLPDGKFVVMGGIATGGNGTAEPLVVGRFNADGSIDRTFNGGLTTYSIFGDTMGDNAAGWFAADGELIITGLASVQALIDSKTNALSGIATLRLGTDGKPDQSFAPGGYTIAGVEEPAGTNYLQSQTFSAAAPLPGGGAVVYLQYWLMDQVRPDVAFQLVAVRTDTTGAVVSQRNLDSRLANWQEDPGGMGGGGNPYSVAIGPNGSIFLASTLGPGVEKLQADGRFDPSFGRDGIATPPGISATLWGVDADGRPILSEAMDESFTKYGLVRLNADGSRDSAFPLMEGSPFSFGAITPLTDGSVALAIGNNNTTDGRPAGISVLVVSEADSGQAGEFDVPAAFAVSGMPPESLSAGRRGLFSSFESTSLFGDNGSNLFGDDSVAN